MTCRTCKWWDVKPRKDGKIVPRKGDYFRCKVAIPDPPAMPASVRIYRRGVGAHGFGDLVWPDCGGHIGIDDGEGCTFHEPRLKA